MDGVGSSGSRWFVPGRKLSDVPIVLNMSEMLMRFEFASVAHMVSCFPAGLWGQ